jgi:hypothetical protein
MLGKECTPTLNVFAVNLNVPKALSAGTPDNGSGKLNGAELTIWYVLRHSLR